MPFASASASASPTRASTSGSLYETAVNRWYSTKVSASWPCPARVAVEEDPLVRHENVVEDGQRLDHLVSRGDRPRPRVGVGVEEVRAEELHARCRDRHRERDRPVLLALCERTGRDHDHLVDVGGARRVDLRAAHDDAVRPAVDDPHVEVGIALGRGALRAVALDVGLADRQRQIAVAAVLVERSDVVGAVGPVRDALEREEGVRADLLDEDDERVREGGGALDQRRAPPEIGGRSGQVVVGRVAIGHGELVVARLLGEGEVERAVARGDARAQGGPRRRRPARPR